MSRTRRRGGRRGDSTAPGPRGASPRRHARRRRRRRPRPDRIPLPTRVERDDAGQVAPDEMIDLAEPSVVRILGLDRVAAAPPPARGDGFGKSKFLENPSPLFLRQPAFRHRNLRPSTNRNSRSDRGGMDGQQGVAERIQRGVLRQRSRDFANAITGFSHATCVAREGRSAPERRPRTRPIGDSGPRMHSNSPANTNEIQPGKWENLLPEPRAGGRLWLIQEVRNGHRERSADRAVLGRSRVRLQVRCNATQCGALAQELTHEDFDSSRPT